eukprot:COSAG02_NODE_10596_length_1904_cov_1.625485_2_plen_129_part_00
MPHEVPRTPIANVEPNSQWVQLGTGSNIDMNTEVPEGTSRMLIMDTAVVYSTGTGRSSDVRRRRAPPAGYAAIRDTDVSRARRNARRRRMDSARAGLVASSRRGTTITRKAVSALRGNLAALRGGLRT